jgi:hypothetical protein
MKEQCGFSDVIVNKDNMYECSVCKQIMSSTWENIQLSYPSERRAIEEQTGRKMEEVIAARK